MTREELEAVIRQAMTRRDREQRDPRTSGAAADNKAVDTILAGTDQYATTEAIATLKTADELGAT